MIIATHDSVLIVFETGVIHVERSSTVRPSTEMFPNGRRSSGRTNGQGRRSGTPDKQGRGNALPSVMQLSMLQLKIADQESCLQSSRSIQN